MENLVIISTRSDEIQQVIADARRDVEAYPGAIKTTKNDYKLQTHLYRHCDPHRPI